jgi:hypothetical protein
LAPHKKFIIPLVIVVCSAYFLAFITLLLALYTARLSVNQIAVFALYGMLAAAVLAVLLWIILMIIPAIGNINGKGKSGRTESRK